jgi:hypothetical protein
MESEDSNGKAIELDKEAVANRLDGDMSVTVEPSDFLTPIPADSVVINPKIDEEPLDLECPECGEVIEGVSGNEAEYRCGCDELRRFRVKGSESKTGDTDE